VKKLYEIWYICPRYEIPVKDYLESYFVTFYRHQVVSINKTLLEDSLVRLTNGYGDDEVYFEIREVQNAHA
jgi:hypothetical protein